MLRSEFHKVINTCIFSRVMRSAFLLEFELIVTLDYFIGLDIDFIKPCINKQMAKDLELSERQFIRNKNRLRALGLIAWDNENNKTSKISINYQKIIDEYNAFKNKKTMLKRADLDAECLTSTTVFDDENNAERLTSTTVSNSELDTPSLTSMTVSDTPSLTSMTVEVCHPCHPKMIEIPVFIDVSANGKTLIDCKQKTIDFTPELKIYEDKNTTPAMPSGKIAHAVINLFNKKVEEKKLLNKAKSLSKGREKYINSLSKKYSLDIDAWDKYMELIFNNEKLNGMSNPKWSAQFFWLIQEDAYLSVIEGAYAEPYKEEPVSERVRRMEERERERERLKNEKR